MIQRERGREPSGSSERYAGAVALAPRRRGCSMGARDTSTPQVPLPPAAREVPHCAEAAAGVLQDADTRLVVEQGASCVRSSAMSGRAPPPCMSGLKTGSVNHRYAAVPRQAGAHRRPPSCSQHVAERTDRGGREVRLGVECGAVSSGDGLTRTPVVASPGAYGSRGCRFESCRAHPLWQVRVSFGRL